MRGLRKERRDMACIPRAALRNTALSFRARGLLAYLLDLPDGFDVRSDYLASQGTEGREAVRTALRELGRAGYYRIERRRMADSTFTMGTAVSDEPIAEWAEAFEAFGGKPVPVREADQGHFVPAPLPVGEAGNTGISEDGFPGAGEPDTGNPVSGNPAPFLIGEREEEPSLRSGSSPANDRGGDPVREDVEQLCQLMVDLAVGNGCRRPTVTKRWRDAARLLLDRDLADLGEPEVRLQRAMNLLRWAAADSFWRANVLSIPTFRERYDQLRLQAVREWEEQRPAARRSTTDDRVAAALSLRRPEGDQASDRLAIGGGR